MQFHLTEFSYTI